MNAPAVSVCIVTFNQERYIRDCVMSVVQQAEDVDIEILVGDDRSRGHYGVPGRAVPDPGTVPSKS
jgi:GT2 family glycosyltransferase